MAKETVLSGPMGLPEEADLLGRAQKADETREQALTAGAPVGEFTASGLNELVDALNQVLPMFGTEEPYPTFTEDIDGALPAEFVGSLEMVAAAATDSGLERLSFSVMELEDEAAFESVAAKMTALAGNQSFKTWLMTDSNEDKQSPEDNTPEPVEAVLPPEENSEDLFVSRM